MDTTQTTAPETDILTQIAAKGSAPKQRTRLARRYQVAIGRWSRRLYTYRQAQRAVRLGKALGADPYISSMLVRVPL